MNARTFLIYGLLAGLLAGLAMFLVGYTVGEPQVDAAIAVEEAGSAAEEPAEEAGHTHAEGEAEHSHGEDAEVSRATQSTWGLLTGTLAVGVATGGVMGLIAAAVAGRIRSLRVGQSTALVTAIAAISYSFVPFLKYPATPPAVGNGETIGYRTGLYFAFVAVSVIVAILATVAATRLSERMSTYRAVVAGVLSYLVIVVIAAIAFPTVNEIGDFPADTLWYFRVSSFLTLASLWGVIAVVLTGLVGRAASQASTDVPVAAASR